MWKGKMTEELEDLFVQYMDEHNGMPPDGYVELCYNAMTYDEFVGYIKDALQRHCSIVKIINELEGYTEE